MKILAIKLRAIGDTVIWTSALETLHQAWPQAEIHTLTYAMNAPVLQEHPAVTRAMFLNSSSHLELLSALWQARREKYDLLLGFHATTSLCRWSGLTGIKRRALHHHSRHETPKGSTVPIPEPGRLEDAIRRDHRVLEAIGIFETACPTHIEVLPAEISRANERLSEVIGLAKADSLRPRFAFLPGAGHHLRRYPVDQWLPLAQKMAREGRFQPVVLVDEKLSKELGLRALCLKHNLPLLDQGSLREFMAAVSTCQGALANDSGPGHIAVALNLPTHFVFGPGCVGDWHPYDRIKNPLHRIAVDCRANGPRDQEAFQFCTVETCEHQRCLKENRFEL